MLSFAVSQKKNEWLKEQMKVLGVTEEDIEEKFVKSSGKGGQKVNKTSSCVFLRHKPTGVEVRCMRERSQSINRFLARRELLEKIASLQGIQPSENIRRNRIKKQKERRKRRSLKRTRSPHGIP